LPKRFTGSSLILGIIEELDIFKVKAPGTSLYGSERLAIQELIASIKVNGLLQPIIVRTKENYYEIVAGTRRYNACRSLGWRKIVCHIVELDDKEAFEVSLTENIQRKTLDVIEEARAFKTYVDNFGWGGITDLSLKIGKSPSYIYKRMSLLDLPPDTIQAIQQSLIKASAAEELASIKDTNQRDQIADLLTKKRISCRKIRELSHNSGATGSVYDYDKELSNQDIFYQDKIATIDAEAQRSFDKSIIAIKIAISKIASIIEDIEGNWIVYEVLMQHKNVLNSQVDLLIKEKRKL
jgi:ParB family chromosome partitioning protein